MNFLAKHFDTGKDGQSGGEFYVISHSASGGHLARYFLDRCESRFLHNISAVAFTDSTHSVQWSNSDERRVLFDFLQCDRCIYFRCAREGDGVAGDGNLWYLHPAGQEVQTDSFWKHRFGRIRTVWAGTNEHSLTNWYSHAKIWEHFDQFLAIPSLAHGEEASSHGSEQESLSYLEARRDSIVD